MTFSTGIVASGAWLLVSLGLGCGTRPTLTGDEGDGFSVPASRGTPNNSTPTPTPNNPAPVGWGAVSDRGLDGTTGGQGGPVVTPTTIADFKTYAGMPGPLVIQIAGTIGDGINTEVASNKTIVGIGERPTFHGNLDMKDVQNVIIRNLFIVGGSPDGISLRRTHHVWVDHVDISDSVDGNLDITDQSDHVTVSWSKFWYSDPRQTHRVSNLIGSSDAAVLDEGTLRVTYHHNWWADLVGERMPRVRYGDVHLFNNYYSSTGNAYCIWAAYHARVLVEGNYFKQVNTPLQHEATGNLLERNNIYDMVTGLQAATGIAFDPPYPYTPDDAAAVPGLVMANAGPRATAEM